MTLGRAIAVVKSINSPDPNVDSKEKVEAVRVILEAATLNSITKQDLLRIIGWLWEQLSNQSNNQEWVDAKCTLPPLDEMVLVIANGNPSSNVTLDKAYELAEWTGEGWILEAWPEWEKSNVSYWRPLPNPPLN